jgi:hypothetical protein
LSSLELGEDKHSFVADFESINSWNLLEVRSILVFVWDEIIVKVIWKIVPWNLILHHHGIRNSIDNCSCNFLKEFFIFSFVKSCVPCMLFAVLAGFNNKNDFIVLVTVSVH